MDEKSFRVNARVLSARCFPSPPPPRPFAFSFSPSLISLGNGINYANSPALHFADNAAAANCAPRGFIVGHKVSNARRDATACLREIISAPGIIFLSRDGTIFHRPVLDLGAGEGGGKKEARDLAGIERSTNRRRTPWRVIISYRRLNERGKKIR